MKKKNVILVGLSLLLFLFSGGFCQAASKYDAIIEALQAKSGQSFDVKIINSPDIFSRVHVGTKEIEVSRSLLDAVYKKSGKKGVAFMLGHEMAHCSVGPKIKGAAVEFEADRLGFDLARKAYPGVDGNTVKNVLSVYDSVGARSKMEVFLNRVKGAVQLSHPTDAARLTHLAKQNAYSKSLGFDKVARQTGHQAIDTARRRTRGITQGAGAAIGNPGGVKGAIASVKRDMLKGGLLMDVAVTAGLSIIQKVSSGGSLSEGLSETGKYLTSSTFIAGDLMGGALGAALGSMIPIPGGLAAAGLFGQAFASLPALGGAMLGAHIGVTAITLLKEGRFSLSNLASSIDLIGVGFRSIGASMGMALGSLIPIPVVGTMVGGILGGMLMDKVLTMIRGRPAMASAERLEKSEVGGDVNVSSHDEKKASTGRPITIEHVKTARDKAYAAFVRATKEGKPQEAVEHLKEYQKYEKMISDMLAAELEK